MKVLHVLRSDGFAGVERHVATLATAQARAGHHVTVIGGDAALMGVTLDGSGVQPVQGNTVPEVVAQVRRRRDVDVVHAHMTAGELGAALAATSPVVVTRHFAGPRGATPVGRLAGTLIRSRVRAQIAISRYVADSVEGPTTVVYPGVPLVGTHDRARRPVVLVVQRLQREKNTDVALRAFAAGAPSGWSLEIVGRGPERQALQSLAGELGIADRVRFLGFRDDVPDLLRSASLLLAPCEVEGLGLSVLEAMAHGLPVVASRAGAHPETVGRADGARLYAPGDWRQAGHLLSGLARDPSARERYGAQLALVQQTCFTPEAQARATDAVYGEVLA